MKYTKEQISEIISKHVEQRNGINDLLSIMLESMMLAERGALPSEESVLLLMGKTAMDKDAYDRVLPWMELDKTLFPGE